ncbi:hypothetical protein D770_05445 [Flammeovirgaceae bacterium 311]|nr:hypothetical protein D770_05445 [Flammeovirgaceae bacterium 311]
MKRYTTKWMMAGFVLCLCFSLSYLELKAQQLNLDNVVKAGELTLFQEVQNENAYYYLTDKPKLAKDENGKPKFSFLRYVKNVRSGAEEAELREGEGGGIVHAVVELSVSEDQLQEARQALKRIDPNAVIKGPVVYRSGTIALISSFANADGDLTKQVIGLGKAPIIDGQQAAISVQLTKKGAEILWESFKTSTPDMSISFEMNIDGYRSPKRALIEADFEQVYEHKNFQAAVAAPILAAEIKATFDDLVKKGAIKVTQVGEDQNLEKIMETAYNKLLEMMFQPAGGTGTPSLGALGSLTGGNSPSLLDRATTMLNTSRAEARTENDRIRRENTAERARAEAERRSAQNQPTNENPPAEGTAPAADSDSTGGAVRPDTRYHARRPSAPSDDIRSFSPTERATAEPTLQEEVSVPSLAITASYEMKRIRQHGIFTIDLNKYTSDNLSMRFDGNFGELKCTSCFHQVNLDDELYKQRELLAMIDGANATDFGSFINFATVSLRKKHQNGDYTYDEVRVDRNNFNKEGNIFKMLYGWKGDSDRSKWMEYETKTSWSFFGGHSTNGEWTRADVNAITLSPPYLSKNIHVEADPDIINEKGVRAIDLKIYYKIGDHEQTKSVTLIPKRSEFSKQVSIIQPKDATDFEYEFEWTLAGNKKVSSKRMATNSAIIFVDDIPENN